LAGLHLRQLAHYILVHFMQRLPVSYMLVLIKENGYYVLIMLTLFAMLQALLKV
jgi:hypothetical protein